MNRQLASTTFCVWCSTLQTKLKLTTAIDDGDERDEQSSTWTRIKYDDVCQNVVEK